MNEQKSDTTNTINTINTANSKKRINNDYIDDLELTKLLLKEIDEFNEGKRKSVSNELAKHYLHILDRILLRSNFKNYSDDYKEEFRSKAQILFVKHWYKFRPESIRKNWYTKNKQKFLKDKSEWKGAFTWFSLLCWTGCTDEIKRLNKIAENRKKIIEEENQDLKSYEYYSYNHFK